jgi:methylated-DNA-[protein]-cysteine S-methyltransferase
MLFTQSLMTPLGSLQLEATEAGLSAIHFPSRAGGSVETSETTPVLDHAIEELTAYFESTLTRFSVPLVWTGTPFQEAVWGALTHIPFGETVSYREVAQVIGRPQSARPVGGAVGRNPLPIIVPCHRVVGSTGALTGFTGGLTIKVSLLTHEGHCFPDGLGI